MPRIYNMYYMDISVKIFFQVDDKVRGDSKTYLLGNLEYYPQKCFTCNLHDLIRFLHGLLGYLSYDLALGKSQLLY